MGTVLDFYSTTDHVTTWSGPYGAPFLNPVEIVRVGNVVTVRIPQMLSTSSFAAYIQTDTSIHNNFRPLQNISQIVQVRNNTVVQSGLVLLKNNGAIEIYATVDGGNFGATGDVGLEHSVCITYTMV